jgi:hypothetical protein
MRRMSTWSQSESELVAAQQAAPGLSNCAFRDRTATAHSPSCASVSKRSELGGRHTLDAGLRMSLRSLWSRLLPQPRPRRPRAEAATSTAIVVAPLLPEPLRQALADTVAWCSTRAVLADPQSSLRGEPFGSRSTCVIDTAFVLEVARWRSGRAESQPTVGEPGGRLLAYFPDLNLCDGAAEAESSGYLDVENCPPWETWVALLEDTSTQDSGRRRVLISWVPSVFIPLASAGIRVNPEECIVWLDEYLPDARALSPGSV